MSSQTERFERAIARFDDANRADPNRSVVEGREWPEQLLYSVRMTEWLQRLAPEASEALRLAVRCQHIQRWTIPRSTYPMDRAGYHRWRSALAKFHAETAGRILREVAYDEATIARVQSLVRKERLKDDAEAQLLEDVVCLVFLENYFAEFSRQHDEQKVIGILRKTWRKMSAQGQGEALKLPLSPDARALLNRALAP